MDSSNYAVCIVCGQEKMIARDGTCHWCLHVQERDAQPFAHVATQYNWSRQYMVKGESSIPPAAPIKPKRRQKTKTRRAKARASGRNGRR